MNNETRAKNAITWIDRLLVTNFKQATEELGNKENGFCCLGVACHILKIDYNDAAGMSDELADVIGLHNEEGNYIKSNGDTDHKKALIALNDIEKYTFKQIAAAIIKKPFRYFEKNVARAIKAHYGEQR